MVKELFQPVDDWPEEAKVPQPEAGIADCCLEIAHLFDNLSKMTYSWKADVKRGVQPVKCDKDVLWNAHHILLNTQHATRFAPHKSSLKLHTL
jgi:hypothetical protein